MSDPSSPIQATASDEPSGPRADTLFGSLTCVLLLAVAQRGLGFVREVLLCRWLDQDEVGQWALAFLFLASGAAIVSLGIQGSMTRYVEHYRQRGQLRTYLRRVACTSLLLAIAAALVVGAFRETFSELLFGRGDRQELIVVLAAALGVVVVHNFLLDFFTALRLFRVVSAMQFAGGTMFVVLSIAAMLAWRADSLAVAAAYGAAQLCVVVAAGVIAWRTSRSFAADSSTSTHRSFWPHVLRASAALWGYNCLNNLFEVADRYMLVHVSGLEAEAALALVGAYHSARVVPSLLATGAMLVASTLMPHWSHAWESGRRAEIAQRQLVALKLMALGLFSAGVIVVVAAPLLFDVAFAGKYRAGQEVLPWVLAAATWTGLAAVAFNYLWCAERLGLCAATLAVGVVVNLSLNFALIPTFGLLGAVLATGVGQFVQLSLVYRLSKAYGMSLDLGLWLLTAAPATLWLGPWASAAIAAAMVALAIGTDRIFAAAEKQEMIDFATPYLDRLRLRRRFVAGR
ncbi:MAG: lipopolysaccharide biosynthesis protein [Pirellulales bacterium]